MKKFLSGFLALIVSACTPAAALNDPKITEWNTWHSMGCMLLRECKDGVRQIYSSSDISEYFEDISGKQIQAEFDELLLLLNQIGVGVFIADSKYFPLNNRGAYHTIGNNFFLNKEHMAYPYMMIAVVRHEGWHAAQDCMAGTIENNNLAVIFNDIKIPEFWKELAEHTYIKEREKAVPWEQEAMWAGHTPFMTIEALTACTKGSMWEIYPPTPMTKEWLEDNGFMK